MREGGLLPKAFVLAYGILLSGSASIALTCSSFAPTTTAARATSSAPLYCICSNWTGEPCSMPTRETTVSALSNAWVRVFSSGRVNRHWGQKVISRQCFFQFGIDVVGISRRNLDVPQYSSSVVRFADHCGDVWTEESHTTYNYLVDHVKRRNLISLSTPMSAIC